LLALALLTENGDNEDDEYQTTEVFSVYKQVYEAEGTDPLKLVVIMHRWMWVIKIHILMVVVPP